MFRTMRRANKQISREEMLRLVEEARYGVLAVHGDNGYPYAIPLNYLYEDGRIYFHGAALGHKADSIAADDRVCFTIVGEEVIRDEDWAPWTKSAVLFGRCRRVSEREKALDICRRFAVKYFPSEEMAHSEVSASGGSVTIYEIQIEHMTGKEIQEK